MPILNFQRRFVAPILAGTKVHTIRCIGCRPHKEGETLFMQTGSRFRPERFKTVPALRVRNLRMTADTVMIDQPSPGLFMIPPLDLFAVADGFEDWMNMLRFFIDRYRLMHKALDAQLIQWAPALWEEALRPAFCRDCGGPMPARDKCIRNVCNRPGEFPYCSRDCAEHAYWQRDLPACLSAKAK